MELMVFKMKNFTTVSGMFHNEKHSKNNLRKIQTTPKKIMKTAPSKEIIAKKSIPPETTLKTPSSLSHV